MRILEIERLHCIVMGSLQEIFTNMQIQIYMALLCYAGATVRINTLINLTFLSIPNIAGVLMRVPGKTKGDAGRINFVRQKNKNHTHRQIVQQLFCDKI